MILSSFTCVCLCGCRQPLNDKQQPSRTLWASDSCRKRAHRSGLVYATVTRHHQPGAPPERVSGSLWALLPQQSSRTPNPVDRRPGPDTARTRGHVRPRGRKPTDYQLLGLGSDLLWHPLGIAAGLTSTGQAERAAVDAAQQYACTRGVAVPLRSWQPKDVAP